MSETTITISRGNYKKSLDCIASLDSSGGEKYI